MKSHDAEALKTQMTDILIRRKSKQPLEFPNAGSMYKRPPGTYAGKLIEEAGLFIEASHTCNTRLLENRVAAPINPFGQLLMAKPVVKA